jgi:molecular chaperone IbpA
LVVEGSKAENEEEEYLHRGLGTRKFTRKWSIAEDVKINSVTFEDGLLVVNIGKIVPEHHARKDYL